MPLAVRTRIHDGIPWQLEKVRRKLLSGLRDLSLRMQRLLPLCFLSCRMHTPFTRRIMQEIFKRYYWATGIQFLYHPTFPLKNNPFFSSYPVDVCLQVWGSRRGENMCYTIIKTVVILFFDYLNERYSRQSSGIWFKLDAVYMDQYYPIRLDWYTW